MTIAKQTIHPNFMNAPENWKVVAATEMQCDEWVILYLIFALPE
jgi:hypothetical protein